MKAAEQERPVEAALTAARLLAALEIFTTQQTIWIRAGNCERALAAQQRATPLVARLRELGPSAIAGMRARLGDLLERQRENLAGLAARRTYLTAERERLVAARERLRTTSAYARCSARRAPSRLSALS